MSTPSCTVSKFTPQCVARIAEEWPLSRWSTQASLRLDMALELVSSGIDVYLIEWEGESSLQQVLPGQRIANQIVGVVEGDQVWSQTAHNFATASKLVAFYDTSSYPWKRRQKALVY